MGPRPGLCDFRVFRIANASPSPGCLVRASSLSGSPAGHSPQRALPGYAVFLPLDTWGVPGAQDRSGHALQPIGAGPGGAFQGKTRCRHCVVERILNIKKVYWNQCVGRVPGRA